MQTYTDRQGHMFYTSKTTPEDILLSFSNSEEWLTRRQICTRVWRKKSPNIIAIIENLVEQDKLIKVKDYEGDRFTWWYRNPNGGKE